jgi:hypothetical protein
MTRVRINLRLRTVSGLDPVAPGVSVASASGASLLTGDDVAMERAGLDSAAAGIGEVSAAAAAAAGGGGVCSLRGIRALAAALGEDAIPPALSNAPASALAPPLGVVDATVPRLCGFVSSEKGSGVSWRAAVEDGERESRLADRGETMPVPEPTVVPIAGPPAVDEEAAEEGREAPLFSDILRFSGARGNARVLMLSLAAAGTAVAAAP